MNSQQHSAVALVSATPALIVDDGASAIDFYVRVFDAKERACYTGANGEVLHAELAIGASVVFLSDAVVVGRKSPNALGGSPCSIWLSVPDVDAVYRSAIREGATTIMEPFDQPWGDRMAVVQDPSGHVWDILTRKTAGETSGDSEDEPVRAAQRESAHALARRSCAAAA